MLDTYRVETVLGTFGEEGIRMVMKLGELAQRLGGELKGDPDIEILGVKPIDEAESGYITFVANPKYVRKARDTRASAIIVSPALRDLDKNLIIHENPYLAFARATGLLMARDFPPPCGVSPQAYVDPSATLGEDVSIGPYVCICRNARIGNRVALYPGVYVGEECEIGDDTVIYPNCVLYPQTSVGQRVVIHANVTIGSAGFGYAPNGRHWEKIPQVSRAIICDDVEIGANSVVNRGALRDTIIGRGTKIDSLVIVSHGVQIGEDTLLVSQVGIAGSATIGNHCIIGGQVGIAGHIKIGDNVSVGAQAGVASDLESGKEYLGAPAIELSRMRRCVMVAQRLPELRDQVRELERRIRQLEAKLKDA